MAAARLVMLAVIAGCAIEAPAPEPSTLLVSDYAASAIVRYDGVSGEFIDVFASGSAAHVDRPAGLRVGPDGNLYSAGFGRGDVVRYDLHSGDMMDVFYWDTTLLEEPVALLFSGTELVVLGNDTANTVVISPEGVARRSFGYPTMRAAHDFALGAGNQLYVATDSHPQLGTAVQVWDLATGTLVRSFGTIDELSAATGIALGDDGLLYVSDGNLGRVVRFDPETGESRGVLVDGLTAPVSLDFAPDGALYVLDAIGLHRIDARSGARLAQLVTVGDGHLVRPRSFMFVTP